SSRRRHTRFSRDWSSDVCSSDLGKFQRENATKPLFYLKDRRNHQLRIFSRIAFAAERSAPGTDRRRCALPPGDSRFSGQTRRAEIGRASCRERMEIREEGDSTKK